MEKYIKILAIDTSCDETAAAVTNKKGVVTNTIWSQASAHAKFGGVMPSLAQRMHKERIDFVIKKALGRKHKNLKGIDAVAVTTGPGLAIALGVGIEKAKELAKKYKKPLLKVNHIEAHLLSPLAKTRTSNAKVAETKFPCYSLVVSGGNTIFIKAPKIGKYQVLAETTDDALGEALDKGARMLGLGYPGGAILEKMARMGNLGRFSLPIPLVGQEKRQIFSYSGLKTSFSRLIEAKKNKRPGFPYRQDIYDLAATYQDAAFTHIERVLDYILTKEGSVKIKCLLLGGGVAANIELRKRLRKLCKKHGLNLLVPYSAKLTGDNAAMIGIAAYLNPNKADPLKIDREPRQKLS